MYLNNRILFISLLIVSLFLSVEESGAQMLQDPSAVDLVKKGISHIYNLEFDDAQEILNKINSEYKGHPATYMYKRLMIYWQNYPLTPLLPVNKGFELQLQTCMRLCESTDDWMDNPETLLLDLGARGLLMLFYSENDMSGDIIPMARVTYRCIRKSFQFTSVYPDFNYFTGLYNYYREAYPEHHPVYKAVAFLFPSGDKEKGLEELRTAAENSIFLKAEAYSLLSWICLYYEDKFSEALYYSRTLFGEYPANRTFMGEYVKNLIFLKKYNEAEEILKASAITENTYFQGQRAVFNGLIREKKYHDYSGAEDYYVEGIKDMKTLGARGEDYQNLGEEGLKRIKSLREGRTRRRE